MDYTKNFLLCDKHERFFTLKINKEYYFIPYKLQSKNPIYCAIKILLMDIDSILHTLSIENLMVFINTRKITNIKISSHIYKISDNIINKVCKIILTLEDNTEIHISSIYTEIVTFEFITSIPNNTKSVAFMIDNENILLESKLFDKNDIIEFKHHVLKFRKQENKILLYRVKPPHYFYERQIYSKQIFSIIPLQYKEKYPYVYKLLLFCHENTIEINQTVSLDYENYMNAVGIYDSVPYTENYRFISNGINIDINKNINKIPYNSLKYHKSVDMLEAKKHLMRTDSNILEKVDYHLIHTIQVIFKNDNNEFLIIDLIRDEHCNHIQTRFSDNIHSKEECTNILINLYIDEKTYTISGYIITNLTVGYHHIRIPNTNILARIHIKRNDNMIIFSITSILSFVVYVPLTICIN